MGLIDTSKNKTLQAGFDQLRVHLINPNIAQFGKINSISFIEKTLSCTVVLLGLENEELEVSCSNIEISEDGSTITLKDFKSNKIFLENALNKFATSPIVMPDNPLIRAGLQILKAIID